MISQPSMSLHSIASSYRHHPQPQPILNVISEIQQHYFMIMQLFQKQEQFSTDNKQVKETYDELRQKFMEYYESIQEKMNGMLKGFSQSIGEKIGNCDLNQEMTFMEMVGEIESQDVRIEELFQFLDGLKVQSGNDLVMVARGEYETKEGNQKYYDPGYYFQLDISELFIEIVCKKIDNRQPLSNKQQQLVSYISHDIISSQQLRKQFYFTRQRLQLQYVQINHFLSQVSAIQTKLKTLSKKSNFIPSLQNQFTKSDITRSNKINYSTFTKIFQKLRLTLSDSEISTLFRFAIYSQTNTYQQLISKSYLIKYRDFISLLFHQHQNKQNISNNRVFQYRSLMNNLKAQKTQLNKVLTQRQNRIQALESKLLQYELQNSNKQTTTYQILKNQRSILKNKYEGEIMRLKKVNESQKQMIDSYRIQLENIMSQIHTRQK